MVAQLPGAGIAGRWANMDGWATYFPQQVECHTCASCGNWQTSIVAYSERSVTVSDLLVNSFFQTLAMFVSATKSHRKVLQSSQVLR